MGPQLGSYQLTTLLGRGGMGEIWRASHRFLKRPAAVKLIRPETLAGRTGDDAKTTLLRFEREVQATALLTSPHTVRIYDYGHESDGIFYYAMELLNGCNLDELVTLSGPLAPGRALHILAQTCESLAEAHHNGLVHRDVKPANLFLCRQGLAHDYVKVLDFGLVVPSQVQSSDAKLTAENFAVGTPAFLAPEAALGGTEIGPRSDVYALGCVAYWLLTGTLVFPGGSPLEVALKHVRDRPEPPSRRLGAPVPPALEAAIMRCLEKEPRDRPADAHALALLLRGSAPGSSWSEEDATRWWRQHRPAPLAAVAADDAPIAEMPAVATPRLSDDSGDLRSIAVLPLANLMADPGQDYFVLGMHETLISELSRIGALSVISRTSVIGYQDSKKRIGEIARELGVSAVMEGSVLRAGESVRISLRLISAVQERTLWSQSYDAQLRDVFELQSRIASEVAARVKVVLTPEEQQHTVRRRPMDPRVLDLFLRAEAHSVSFMEPELLSAIAVYEQAIAIDPDCAGAYAGLARCHNNLATFGNAVPRDAFPKSVAALKKALALDPNLPSAYASLGYARLYFEWDFESPRALFERALSIEPSNVGTLCDYGRYLAVVGDPRRSAEVLARAIVLDPHSPLTRMWSGWGHYVGSEFAKSVAVFEGLVESTPRFVYGHLWLATSLVALGEKTRALALASKLAETEGESPDHNLVCVLASTLALAGDTKAAERMLARLLTARTTERWTDPSFIAVIYAALGDHDRALEELRTGFDLPSILMVYLERHPMLDPLRKDARFLELCLRVRMSSRRRSGTGVMLS